MYQVDFGQAFSLQEIPVDSRKRRISLMGPVRHAAPAIVNTAIHDSMLGMKKAAMLKYEDVISDIPNLYGSIFSLHPKHMWSVPERKQRSFCSPLFRISVANCLPLPAVNYRGWAVSSSTSTADAIMADRPPTSKSVQV